MSSGATVEVLKLIVKLHMRVHCRVSAKRRIRKSLLHVPIRKFEESKELQLLRLCILTLDDVKELNLFFFFCTLSLKRANYLPHIFVLFYCFLTKCVITCTVQVLRVALQDVHLLILLLIVISTKFNNLSLTIIAGFLFRC